MIVERTELDDLVDLREICVPFVIEDHKRILRLVSDIQIFVQRSDRLAAKTIEPYATVFKAVLVGTLTGVIPEEFTLTGTYLFSTEEIDDIFDKPPSLDGHINLYKLTEDREWEISDLSKHINERYEEDDEWR